MPGAGKQPPEVQENIKELLEAGFDPTTIHRRLKVGRSSIYRMKRCLQQHGTAYMPTAMNKKNGRPKVLTAEQELEVRDWLRTPENRGRYLDDLVWLIHDRFGIVCSTTTMSKMKRKWLRVIEYEETGRPLDESTKQSLYETHPDLSILQDPVAMMPEDDGGLAGHHEQNLQNLSYSAPPMQDPGPAMMMMQAPQAIMQQPMMMVAQQEFSVEPQIDTQLEAQIQQEIASTDPTRV